MTITLGIIILTCLISYQGINDRNFLGRFSHYPYATIRNKEWYRFLTSGFVHNSWFHLGINMFVLWQFGTYLEQIYESLFGMTTGKILYLIMYLTAIIFAGLPSFYKNRDNPQYHAVGASGAVSGVFLVCGLFIPWQQVLLFLIIPMPFIVAAVGFLFYEQYASKNVQDNIGHDAHFYGAIYAVIFTIIANPKVLYIFKHEFLSGLPF